MNIYHLPTDIFPGTDTEHDPIIIHQYSAPAGSFKGKSILQKSAISLVIEGAKTMRFAEKTVMTNSNEFHFLSAGNCLVSMDLQPEQLFSSILIFFDDSVLIHFLLKYNEQLTKLRRNYTIKPEAYISLQKDDFIRNYISSLDLLIKSGVHVSPGMRALKFEELMLYLLEQHPQVLLSFQLAQQNSPVHLQLRKVVEANITSNISVNELAFLCNMSESTFKRNFAKLYGMPPARWLIRQRMEIAADLLSHQQQKPGAVFHKVGYDNHSSFSQSFRQVFGISPREFQARKLNG